ncbi:MAG TPA: FAD-binding protein, partial [Paracoccaceae bacterium]|nr:FAD-binding protein [Paracoccaceae bacterium]
MEMPVADARIMARKAAIVRRLSAALPGEAVIDDPAELRAYECDALTAYVCPPLAVVLPRSTAEVAAVMRICHEEGVPVVPRGAGTSLAGGSLPTADSVVIGVARLTEVLEIDYANRFIRVQAGRTNLAVTGAVEAEGWF